MIQLNVYQVGFCIGMQSLTQELATELGDLVVQKVKEKHLVAIVNIHADASNTLIFAMSFPEAYRSCVRIVYSSKRLHHGLNSLPPDLFPDVKFLNGLAIFEVSLMLLLNSFAHWRIQSRQVFLVILPKLIN